jgi:hypothetical protein
MLSHVQPRPWQGSRREEAMLNSKLMVRAGLVGLAFGLIQGCTALAPRPADESVTETVVDGLYTKRVYMTGSRIPKVIDVRKSIEMQSAQPMKIIEAR